MTPEITPRLVAEAIAALADEQVRESWAYLDTWDRLARAGVPVADVRRGLDTEPVQTEAMGYVARWAGEGGRGLLVICGEAKGTGKTYAATRFVAREVRGGRRVAWVPAARLSTMSLRERDEYLNRATAAQTMVVDDVGAGVTGYRPISDDDRGKGEHLRGIFEGVIMDRLGRGGTTLVVSNASLLEMSHWLGDRLLDRLKQAGDVVEVRDRTSRRMRDPDDVDRATGQGAAYRKHRKIVSVIGYDAGDRRVGDALIARTQRAGYEVDAEDYDSKDYDEELARTRKGFEVCKAARLLLGLDQGSVQAKARELAEAEARTVAAVAEEFDLDLGAEGLTLEVGLALVARRMASRWRERLREQEEKAAAKPDYRPLICRAVSEGHAWVEGALVLTRPLGEEGEPVVPSRLTAEEVEAARELAEARGCRVRETSQGWDFLIPRQGAA